LLIFFFLCIFIAIFIAIKQFRLPILPCISFVSISYLNLYYLFERKNPYCYNNVILDLMFFGIYVEFISAKSLFFFLNFWDTRLKLLAKFTIFYKAFIVNIFFTNLVESAF